MADVTAQATTVLGIDLGSTTTKVVLADVGDDVRILRIGRVPTPDDAGSLRSAVAMLVRNAAAGAAIGAVGIASMAETGVPLDRDGNALTPLLRWDRARRDDVLAELLRDRPALPERTGIPPTPKPALVALHRLRTGRPDVFAGLDRWQGVADFVAAALTGAHATDHTLAARTMMLEPASAGPGSGDPGRRWDAGLLDELGLGADALPRIVAPGSPAGFTTGAEAEFGLASGIPVFIAGHDHAVGAWAVGVRRPGDVADSLGTAEAVVAVTENADAAAVRDGFSIGRTVDDLFTTVMGGSPACGAMLAQWPSHPLDLLAAAPPDRWPTSPVSVLPYPHGRQCPHPDPRARVATTGDPLAPGDVERGVLQSLILHSRWIRSAMAEHTAATADRIVLLGSLTERIPVWAPLTAASSDAAVLRCTSTEPVAAGAALLAAVRAGLAPDTTVLDTAQVAPCEAPDLDGAYRRFLDAALGARHHDPSEGET